MIVCNGPYPLSLSQVKDVNCIAPALARPASNQNQYFPILKVILLMVLMTEVRWLKNLSYE